MSSHACILCSSIARCNDQKVAAQLLRAELSKLAHFQLLAIARLKTVKTIDMHSGSTVFYIPRHLGYPPILVRGCGLRFAK